MEFIRNMIEVISTDKLLNIGVTAVIVFVLTLIILKCNKLVFKGIVKRSGKDNDLHITFLKRIIDGIIIILGVYAVCNKIEFLKTYVLSIIASSSLLVVVLGFAAQESLANVINGTFISVFKPFNVGDRVKLVSLNLVGVVEDITLRHTVIKTFENSRLLIPNSIMNKEVIENTNFADETVCNFLDVSVAYDADVDKAIEIIQELVREHKFFYDSRTAEDKAEGKPDVIVRVRTLGATSVDLRANIWTKTIGENFEMCSDLRREVLKKFSEEGIEIPYPYTNVIVKQ